MKTEVSNSRALRRRLLIALSSCLLAVLGICTLIFNMIYQQAVRNVNTHSDKLVNQTVSIVSDANYEQFSATMCSLLKCFCEQMHFDLEAYDYHFVDDKDYQRYFFSKASQYFYRIDMIDYLCDGVFLFDGESVEHSFNNSEDEINEVLGVMEKWAMEEGKYADLNDFLRDHMNESYIWYSDEGRGYIVVWDNMMNYSNHNCCIGMLLLHANDWTKPLRTSAQEQTDELLTDMDTLFSKYLYMMIICVVCVFMLFLVVSAVLSKKLADPVVSEHDMLVQVNEMKTAFLSDASHELKTPLAAMSGYAQNAELELMNNEELSKIQEKLRRISSEANRMALMVTQILDATRIEEGRMVLEKAPCDLDSLVRETVETYFAVLNKNNNRLILRIPLELPPIEADSARLQRVFVNLISNALKHTHDGTILIKAEAEDDMITVTVKDTGSGILPEDLPHIWERYYKGKHSETGTGLGLFICKFIVESHGGTIGVESEVDKGTTFRFTLPTSDSHIIT